MRPLYLDYNATTPIAPSVQEAMQPFLAEHFGNPSSTHALGRACSEAIEDARERVAGLLGADRDEIFFTSGGSESNNLALRGVMTREPAVRRGHFIVSNFEHPAIEAPAKYLERLGYELTVVEANSDGIVEAAMIENALRPNTKLVSIMHANNEIGTVQPIRQIAEVCKARGVLVHTDAAQSVGKIRTVIDELGVDLLTIAGHKIYSPKGIGAIYVRKGVALEPLIHGAGHESVLRAGTENTPYIVGLGKSCSLLHKSLDESCDRLAHLRDRLAQALQRDIPGLTVNGGQSPRIPNTLSANFPGVVGADLLGRVPEICASTGAACHSGAAHSSATLKAIGLDPEVAQGTVRLSVGWYTSEEDIDRASSLLVDAWENLK